MTPTEERLTLLANGYSPIRNRDKRTFMPSWPSVEITEAEIKSWERKFSRDKATGIRVENGLAVIDFDINDEAAMKEIANRVFDAVPQLGDLDANLLIRNGKGFKEAWFVRTDEDFGRLHSRAWAPPGQDIDAGTHRVEIFGGASPRQFGALGAHTVADDGTVEISYRWPERSPLDTLLADLPELTKAQFFEIIDIAERALADLGWSPVLKSTTGENDAQRVYDLTDDMSFDINDGSRLSLQQVRDLAHAEPDGGHRCSASFFEGREAVNRTRCLIGVSRAGNLTIWDSAHGATHCEASLKPTDHNLPEINRLAERLAELKDKAKNVIKPGDGLKAAASKLINLYAYCKHGGANDVVPIWATSMDEGFPLQKLRIEMMPHAEEGEPGPKGGRKMINPVDLWCMSEARQLVRGMRLRPDRERPLYEDKGAKWVNIYAPPIHDATGGSPDVGVAFMEYLLPDEAERAWFLQWLAHKVRYPHIPGPAVVMVARKQGTGRGTLAVLLGKLLGQAYVRNISFSMAAGKSYQSQYTDWAADTLLAVISESSETDGASRYSVKKDTYEHLKEMVEPRPTERTYITKREKAFKAMSFTSYIIATNNVDALPIPAEDRRFAILSNGEPMADPEYWVTLNEWLEIDANVAAFHAWLEAIDLSGYSPFVAPIRTAAQQAMMDLGGSDIDRGLDIAFSALVSETFTAEQIVVAMRVAATEYDLSYPPQWDAIAKREAQKRGYRIGVPKGTNWQPLIDGKRRPVYATTLDAARKWKTSDRLREEVLKNGATSTAPGDNVVSMMSRIKKTNGETT